MRTSCCAAGACDAQRGTGGHPEKPGQYHPLLVEYRSVRIVVLAVLVVVILAALSVPSHCSDCYYNVTVSRKVPMSSTHMVIVTQLKC